MELHPTRVITIITEAVIEDELTKDLTALGATGYTVTDVRGRGHRGARNTGWEHEANIRIEVVCEERLAKAIADCLNERYYENYAMILYISSAEVLRPEKFRSEGGETL